MNVPATFEELASNAQKLDLYTKLIQQLNKDMLLANIDFKYDLKITSMNLKLALQKNVYDLIQNKFSDYLKLLYVVDVQEHLVRKLDTNDSLKLSEEITFLILQREWQKVWFKTKYS